MKKQTNENVAEKVMVFSSEGIQLQELEQRKEMFTLVECGDGGKWNWFPDIKDYLNNR